LDRKSVEPMALAGGPAVRTLQVFLAKRPWDEEQALHQLQRHLAGVLADIPDDGLGTIGLIDETSCRKWGDKTPGVQRQYLGCVGKIDNGIVTVGVGVSKGSFHALLDHDLYLPKSWIDDLDRRREAGIPDEIRFRAKWRIAFDQLTRLAAAGHRFDWLTFDEYYGSKVPFLTLLSFVGQRYVGEIPSNFSVKRSGSTRSRKVRTLWTRTAIARGDRIRLTHKTVADTVWRVVECRVEVRGEPLRILTAVCESTAEVKYFVSNDLRSPLAKLLRVAFRRPAIEHLFRLAKQEAGLMHFEGRSYRGLIRHLILSLVVLGFVAEATERLRGEKSAGDRGTSLPPAQPRMRSTTPTPHPTQSPSANRFHDPLPSKA
jgi:SRSO17 transposase